MQQTNSENPYVERNSFLASALQSVFSPSRARISQKLIKRRSYLFFSRGHLVILDAFTNTWKERRCKRKGMTSRRSLPRDTYVLYPPRVTPRSFVEGFRVHDVPTRHVRGSLALQFSLSRSPLPTHLSLAFATEYRVSISPVPRGVLVDLASGMCATSMRRVYVLSSVASLFRLSRLRERISGTLVSRTRYYAASRHMEIIHLSCNTRCIIIPFRGMVQKVLIGFTYRPWT